MRMLGRLLCVVAALATSGCLPHETPEPCAPFVEICGSEEGHRTTTRRLARAFEGAFSAGLPPEPPRSPPAMTSAKPVPPPKAKTLIAHGGPMR